MLRVARLPQAGPAAIAAVSGTAGVFGGGRAVCERRGSIGRGAAQSVDGDGSSGTDAASVVRLVAWKLSVITDMDRAQGQIRPAFTEPTVKPT